jgi:serine/threonine protein kinase
MVFVDNSFYNDVAAQQHMVKSKVVPPLYMINDVDAAFSGILLSNMNDLADFFNRALQTNTHITETCVFGENRYALDKKPLNEGGGSYVYSAYDKISGRVVAVKIGNPDVPFVNQMMRKEFVLQDHLSKHLSTVLPIRDCFVYKGQSGDSVCVVMDKLESSDLFDKYVLGNTQQSVMPVEKILDVGYKTLVSMRKFEELGILHGDIKSENLSDENGLTVLDFGGSMLLSFLGNNYGNSYTQTRGYRAPEIILNSELNGAKSDVWSLGCVLFELFAKERLFEVFDLEETLDSQRNDIQLIAETLGSYPPEHMIYQSRNGYANNFFVKNPYSSNFMLNYDGAVYSDIYCSISKVWELVKKFPRPNGFKATSIRDRMKLAAKRRAFYTNDQLEGCTGVYENKLIDIVESLISYNRPSVVDAIAMLYNEQ